MLGRDFVETISERNTDNNIIIANRGVTNPELFSNFSKIKFDRNIENECFKLKDYYDYIIDFSCYTLNQFKNVINNIEYKKYIYISTMSVFDKHTIDAKNINDNYYWYCINKKEIEDYIISNIKNLLIVRPCAIYGEYDYTQRFFKKDNEYYLICNNKSVKNVSGYMFVKDFTKKLIATLDIDINNVVKTINILS